jgi:hypothetical protein
MTDGWPVRGEVAYQRLRIKGYVSTTASEGLSRMTVVRHCRHCLGDCPGDCLLGDTGMCIHGRNSGKRARMRAQWLISRKWWRRVLWGR